MIKTEVVFIYNARSGWGNALMDSIHKVVSPATYSCALCQLTYGLVGERSSWRDFILSLPMQVRFVHLDEMEVELQVFIDQNDGAPAVVEHDTSGYRLLLSATDLNGFGSLEELMRVLEAKFSGYP